MILILILNSHDYYDSSECENNAFEVDWERCMAKSSFWEFICEEPLPTPFEPKDEVEILLHGKRWIPGVVINLEMDGTADVQILEQRSVERGVSYSNIRYPGGRNGGLGGRNARNYTETTDEIFVPESMISDVVGFRRHQLKSIMHHSGTIITVNTNLIENPMGQVEKEAQEMKRNAKKEALRLEAESLLQDKKRKQEQMKEQQQLNEGSTSNIDSGNDVNDGVEEVNTNQHMSDSDENQKENKKKEEEENKQTEIIETAIEIDPMEKMGKLFTIAGSMNGVKVAIRLIQQAMLIVATKQILRQYYSVGVNAYDFFKSIGSGDVFSMQLNEFSEFGHQSKIINSRFNGEGGGGGSRPSTASSVRSSKNNRTSHTILSHADQVFHVVNDELAALQLHSEIRSEQLGNKFQDFNKDRSIMRFEWQEAIIRLANLKFIDNKNSLTPKGLKPHAIQRLYDSHIVPNLGPNVVMNSDAYRRDRLYTEEVANVVERELKLIMSLFTAVAGSGLSDKYAPHQITKDRLYLITMDEWMEMMQDLMFLDGDFTRREAIFCFTWSKLTVIDDFKCSERAVGLTFIEFIEALCRCSEMKTIPTSVQLEEAGSVDIVAYYDNKIRSSNRHLWNLKSIHMDTHLESIQVLDTKMREEKDPRSTGLRLQMLLTLIHARKKETKKISILNLKRPKKIRRLKAYLSKENNTFDLYSNIFNFTDVIEDENKLNGSGKNAPMSYHSKYITTILPGSLKHPVLCSGRDVKHSLRRGCTLKGVRGKRSPPRK